jgi:predicted RNA binding protein YcfA (HicA-like mRNA interferase family)
MRATEPRRLLARLRSGSLQNVSLRDTERLLLALGFVRARTSGGHRPLRHPGARVTVNLQDADGQIRPYQLRQVLKVLDTHPDLEEGLR